MKSIQRYALATTTCAESGEVHPYMEPCKDGLYVSHADHVREVAALQDRFDALDSLTMNRIAELHAGLAALRAVAAKLLNVIGKMPAMEVPAINEAKELMRAMSELRAALQ